LSKGDVARLIIFCRYLLSYSPGGSTRREIGLEKTQQFYSSDSVHSVNDRWV